MKFFQVFQEKDLGVTLDFEEKDLGVTLDFEEKDLGVTIVFEEKDLGVTIDFELNFEQQGKRDNGHHTPQFFLSG